MSKSVLGAFLGVLPPGKRTGRGWQNFNCPMCGDTRGRAGFLETSSGGFRVRCFNGGCELNSSPTGWEPGSGLGGRPKKFFVSLGGNLSDLPIADLMKTADKFSRSGAVIQKGGETAVVAFDEMPLPPGSVPLDSLTKLVGNSMLVAEYVLSLGVEIASAHQYYWSPTMSSHVIIPFKHRGKTVGWLARNCTKSGSRFISKCPSDYVFRQDTIERGSSRFAIVVEGVVNAIAINGLAIRNAAPTKKQEALLNVCGQDIIVLPDQEPSGLALVEAARKNGWKVSVPDWDSGVKDVVDATRRYGMLYTISSVVAGASTNYLKAKASLNMRKN